MLVKQNQKILGALAESLFGNPLADIRSNLHGDLFPPTIVEGAPH